MSSGAQNQALESLKGQLSQALAELAKQREEHQAEKLGYIERESLLQSERTQLSVCQLYQKPTSPWHSRQILTILAT